MSIDDPLRPIADQAFFEKLIVSPDADGEPGEPLPIFFNPEVQRLVLRRQAAIADLPQPGTPTV